jgi:hypothetical protein
MRPGVHHECWIGKDSEESRWSSFGGSIHELPVTAEEWLCSYKGSCSIEWDVMIINAKYINIWKYVVYIYVLNYYPGNYVWRLRKITKPLVMISNEPFVIRTGYLWNKTPVHQLNNTGACVPLVLLSLSKFRNFLQHKQQTTTCARWDISRSVSSGWSASMSSYPTSLLAKCFQLK